MSIQRGIIMTHMIDYRVKGEKGFIGLEDSKRSRKFCVHSSNHIVH